MKKLKVNKVNAVLEAVKICGSQSELARRCGVNQTTIFRWISARLVPAKKVLLVEKITGVSRYLLNPEIYQKD
jgi:DNA-binding transcriptional regulator YdaS (Cro superfamily)